MPAVSVKLDLTSAKASLSAFFSRLSTEAEQAGKEAAYVGSSDIIDRIEGHNVNIQRVDTHRYASSWAVAGREASGVNVGDEEAHESGDSFGSVSLAGNAVTIDMMSLVEYGEYLEFGTDKIVAGYHVTDSLDAIKLSGPPIFDSAMVAAWGA